MTGYDRSGRWLQAVLLRIRNAAITHSSTELSVSVVTVSAGFCSIIADGQENEGERFKIKADKALYEAKNRGRNRAYGYEKIY